MGGVTLIEKLRQIHLHKFMRDNLSEREVAEEELFIKEPRFSTVDFTADADEFSTFNKYAISQWYYDYMLNSRTGHYLHMYLKSEESQNSTG